MGIEQKNKKQIFILSLIALILCINIGYSSGSSVMPNGILLFGIGIMLTLGFLIIIYMISKLIINPQVDAWIKNEFWQVFVTVVIGAIVILLFHSADSIAQTSGTGTSWNTTAISQVQGQYDALVRGYYSIGNAYFSLSRYTGFSYSRTKGMPIVKYWYTDFESASPGAGLAPLQSQIMQAFNKLSQSLLILMSEIVLLKFIFFAVPLYLLPLGLIFRAFPFTRSFGSTLIAISIALYFLFPLSLYVYNDLLVSVQRASGYDTDIMSRNIDSYAHAIDPGSIPGAKEISTPMASLIALLGDLGFVLVTCTPICAAAVIGGVPWSACWTACKMIAEAVYIIIVPGFQYIYGNGLANHILISKGTLNAMFSLVLDNILPFVAFVWIKTILGFIIALTITVSSVRGLSSAIGGEMQLYGLTRLL